MLPAFKFKLPFKLLDDMRRALVPMSLLARVVSFSTTVKVSPTRMARRSSNKPLCVVVATRVVGTNEPLDVKVISCASGLAVVEPLIKDCLDAEGNSAQPVRIAVTEMSQTIFFITVVLTFAEFDLTQTPTWQ